MHCFEAQGHLNHGYKKERIFLLSCLLLISISKHRQRAGLYRHFIHFIHTSIHSHKRLQLHQHPQTQAYIQIGIHTQEHSYTSTFTRISIRSYQHPHTPASYIPASTNRTSFRARQSSVIGNHKSREPRHDVLYYTSRQWHSN